MTEPKYAPELLSHLIEKEELIWILCQNCYHEVEFPAKDLPLPPEIPVPEIKKHLKCSKCGSKKVHASGELYPGGVIAMRAGR